MTSNIQINVDMGGRGTVLLNGVDISNSISGVNVRIRAGEITKVFVCMSADTEITTDGIVRSTDMTGKITKRSAR
jgi:hypothetical protein